MKINKQYLIIQLGVIDGIVSPMASCIAGVYFDKYKTLDKIAELEQIARQNQDDIIYKFLQIGE